jgi:hypothetical protein
MSQIVVAPRLPSFNKETYRSPFDADGDMVVDCELCGYHAMGPRRQMGLLMKQHHRMYHSEEKGVVLLNQPRQ